MSKGFSLSPLAKPSPVLAHFNRVLASSGGTDRVFMLACYSAKIFNYALTHQKLATKSTNDVAARITKVAGVISDARVLYRLFGLFPIINWLQSMNVPANQAKKDPTLAKIEFLQGLAMLCYYPLEHTYYLAGKGLFDIAPARIGQMARLSCRFWASYVMLELVHLWREKSLLAVARQAVISSRVKKVKESKELSSEENEAEKVEVARIAAAEKRINNSALIQFGYAPLTMHWSLESGVLPDPVWVGIFGTFSAWFSLVGTWRATA